jgi:hypothetical protein
MALSTLRTDLVRMGDIIIGDEPPGLSLVGPVERNLRSIQRKERAK